jgi:four helix bundle protein
MRDYKKIIAWQKADDLTVAVYRESRTFPKDELYGLVSQIRRAVYSVPANIVEGASRNSKRDYLHFLYIARGSLNETRYFLHLARRLGYSEPSVHDNLEIQGEEVARTLSGLIKAVEQESGPFTRATARLSSSLVALLGGVAVCGLRSVV